MELLTASSISVPHGFPTRAGGVSGKPFDSLNTSFGVGDDPLAVRENLARLSASARVEPSKLHFVKQVHGDRVVEASAATPETEADAVWTEVPGTAVGVRTADCVPILIEDPGGRVAAVHAGWRGVENEIVTRTIERLVARGGELAQLRFAIGPCIQRCCFEVDGDLPRRFEAAFGAKVVVRSGEQIKPHLDLPLAVQETLSRLGVPEGHVAVLPQCTMCDARFFSHRREHGVTGRHLSFITLPGAAAL
ncbi:MAG: peptidoglycan editing factor PgeF [Archangium sp.]|nr:peptidoglycan editing factor PgeF [Archangium sp.]